MMGSHVPSLHASLPTCAVPVVDPTGLSTVYKVVNCPYYPTTLCTSVFTLLWAAGWLLLIYSWHIIQYCI